MQLFCIPFPQAKQTFTCLYIQDTYLDMYVYCAYVCGAYVLHVGISPIKWLEGTLAKTERLTIKINNNKTKHRINLTKWR